MFNFLAVVFNSELLVYYHTLREPDSSMGEDDHLIYFLISRRGDLSFLDLDFLYIDDFLRLRDNMV